MSNITTTAMQGIRYLVEANFYFALAILIFGSAVSVSDTYSIFEFNADIYGELANNIRIMMIYIAFTELLIFGYCFMTKQNQYYLLVGFFLIVMIGSLEFYGQVNNVETDPNLDTFFLYTGVSHVLYGAMTKIKPAKNTV
ncbi:MAG: hypothetical protein HOP02_04960 [Methylococcaceae bacterium]|nr:hypothetical protein [Methylococcaceae bacterium]